MELTRVSTHRKNVFHRGTLRDIHRRISFGYARIKPPSKATSHSLGQSWHAAARPLARLTCDHLVTYYWNV